MGLTRGRLDDWAASLLLVSPPSVGRLPAESVGAELDEAATLASDVELWDIFPSRNQPDEI